MMIRYWRAGLAWIMAHAIGAKEPTMQWETPQAIDMRFGMEITMYISNR
jgi:coenzyme PQQ precursor peptide PqqA